MSAVHARRLAAHSLTRKACQLPPRSLSELRARTHPIIKTLNVRGGLNLLSPRPLGPAAQLVEYLLPCLCQSVALRLTLGGQPFSISNDGASEIGFQGNEGGRGGPNTLQRLLFSRLVFYLYFHVTL